MVSAEELVNDVMASESFKKNLKTMMTDVVKQTMDSMPKGGGADVIDLEAYRNREVFLKAAGEMDVQEWKNGSNPQVELYLDYGASESNKDSGLRDDTPWCAGYVAYCLEKVGMGSTNSLRARSYEFWGVSTKNNPMPGDIVTFWRGKKYIKLSKITDWGPGHVGFFVKENATHVWVMGGNQSDEVNITRYSKARMTDIRRSSKQDSFSAAQMSELRSLATDVIAGNTVQAAGSVV